MKTTAQERVDFRSAAQALGWTPGQLADAVRDYLADEDDAECRDGFGAWLFAEARDYREELAPLGLTNWPVCECGAGGGCTESATNTDQGVPVCAGCLEGAVFGEDGASDCRCCGSGDRVVWDESAGYAGGYVHDDAPDEPDEDPDGDWAVVGMDGETCGTYATREDAEAAVEHEATLFTRSGNSRGGAYLPRSVCHLACGLPVRAGQWSTSWYVPGCDHAAVEAE